MPQSSGTTKPERDAFDAIHGNMLRNFGELVADLGGDAQAALRRVGIGSDHRPQTAAGEAARASYRQFVALLENAAAELDCPDFGMRLAVRQAVMALAGPLGDGMRNSRTLGDAIRFACDHSYAHSLAAWIWQKPTHSGSGTLVGHDILLEGLPHRTQAMEYILLVGNLAMRDLTEQQVRARRVLFRHQPLSPQALYRRYFGCEVRFGRGADAVIYDMADLVCPIPEPDPRTCETAAHQLETRFALRKPPTHADVRGIVTHVLGTDHCTRQRVADQLGLHPRTMVRRLAAEGTTFQRIKDEVRRDRLLYLVRHTRLDFTAISEKLGLAEQAVMTRLCRKWFAMSPTGLRAVLRKEMPGD